MAISPVPVAPNIINYQTKRGGYYKSLGSISITPTADLTSTGANAILASMRWTNTDYALVLTAFGIQISSSTGFASANQIGATIYKCTGYTTMDTGGTDVLSTFTTPTLTGMPTSLLTNARMVTGGSATPMTAGTRTLTNPIYAANAFVSTSAGIFQNATIYPFAFNEDEPIIILANEGIEYQITTGLTLPANKNLTIGLISTWAEVPREIITDRYGI